MSVSNYLSSFPSSRWAWGSRSAFIRQQLAPSNPAERPDRLWVPGTATGGGFLMSIQWNDTDPTSWEAPHRYSNFISTPTLRQLVLQLRHHYTLLYYRFCCARKPHEYKRFEGMADDGHDGNDINAYSYSRLLDDKVMLRREFPLDVHLVEDYTGVGGSEEHGPVHREVHQKGTNTPSRLALHNLWLLSIASICRRFITTQGGTSYVFLHLVECTLSRMGMGQNHS